VFIILPSSTAQLNVRPSSALDDGLYFGQASAALRHRVPSRHCDVERRRGALTIGGTFDSVGDRPRRSFAGGLIRAHLG